MLNRKLGIGLLLLVAMVSWAQAGTYTFDAGVADWYAGGFTAVQGGTSLVTLMMADGADVRNQIYVDGYTSGFFGIDPGEWAGAEWTAPAGEVVTGVTIGGYCGHDSSNMGYGVLGGTQTATETIYLSHHEAGFYTYSNVTVSILPIDQVKKLQFRPYWNLEGGVTGAGTNYPSYSGRMTSITITTAAAPKVYVFDSYSSSGRKFSGNKNEY
jgi:hypothetical protein